MAATACDADTAQLRRGRPTTDDAAAPFCLSLTITGFGGSFSGIFAKSFGGN